MWDAPGKDVTWVEGVAPAPQGSAQPGIGSGVRSDNVGSDLDQTEVVGADSKAVEAQGGAHRTVSRVGAMAAADGRIGKGGVQPAKGPFSSGKTGLEADEGHR
ncbi:hypothetical protein M5E06_30790 [Azospirillum sp. A1-3]|uniref:hypothetical protein n=1 Tax=Azospirillum sp. A1-3 TaxID=185874 RepID=UPI002076DC3B|nr:hypothetical protein [Azospirillum sp. A1-3]MCM8738517.1 hypothetical protein [Azospirillum sp. A1-3]